MAQVEFKDFSIQVKGALEETSESVLHTLANELMSQAKRRTKRGKVGGGTTIGSWDYVVDTSKLEATVGNTQENAIWEEFGTGEYALEGKGRKGGWYIPIGEGEGQISQAVVDAYGMKVVHGKNNQDFAFTTGKKPKRMLFNAYTENRAKLIRIAQRMFAERMSGNG